MNGLYDFYSHREICKTCQKVKINETSTYNNTCFEGAKLLKKFLHESEEERVLNKKIQTLGLPNV